MYLHFIVLSYNNPALLLLYRAVIEREASENPILVQLSDDGSGPDFIQNDGIYSRNIKSEYADNSYPHIYKICVCELTNYWRVNYAVWVTMLDTLSSAQ